MRSRTWRGCQVALALVVGGMISVPVVGLAQSDPAPRPTIVRPQRPLPKPRPTRVPRPTRPPRPGTVPDATPTATQTIRPTATATATVGIPTGPQSCPGVPVTCPQVPACRTGNRIGQVYYKYPASTEIITNRIGEMRLNRRSNGIDPDTEIGSFSMVDKDNQVVAQMTNLRFVRSGKGWRADHDDGWVTIAPGTRAGGYNFQFQFNKPTFPPGYFSVIFQLCLSIGDDGIDEQIVCQPKARDGFLCHNNGPTFGGG